MPSDDDQTAIMREIRDILQQQTTFLTERDKVTREFIDSEKRRIEVHTKGLPYIRFCLGAIAVALWLIALRLMNFVGN